MLKIYVDRKGNLHTRCAGTVATVDKDIEKVHRFIAKHAEFTDCVNGKILNGRWASQLDEPHEVGA